MPFPVSTIGGGSALGVPDVCNVPSPTGPVPTPFPNDAQLMMGAPPVTSVLAMGCPVLNMGSKIPLSNGDQAGVMGGVVSGSIMGQVEFTQGSATTFADGMPVIFMGCTTSHNNNNAIGAVIAPSQAVVMVNG
jgi:hypothetical protein